MTRTARRLVPLAVALVAMSVSVARATVTVGWGTSWDEASLRSPAIPDGEGALHAPSDGDRQRADPDAFR
jgi:hypothetical protein